jgi:hypothetical protein
LIAEEGVSLDAASTRRKSDDRPRDFLAASKPQRLSKLAAAGPAPPAD